MNGRFVPKLLVVFTIIYLPFTLTYAEDRVEKNELEQMTLSSPDSAYGELIPPGFTCEGENTSPELNWENAPENTAGFALICDDPDAPGGTWVHWVIYNIPAEANQLIRGIPDKKTFENGTMNGSNSWPRIGYSGPCPPAGKPHRYYFKLYALDKTLELEPGATKEQLLKAMNGHIIAEAEWMGTYSM